MKKTFVIIAISLFFAASFSSCQKCMTCTYTYATMTTDTGEKTVTEELCGSKSDLEAFEEGKQLTAELLGTEATCTTE